MGGTEYDQVDIGSTICQLRRAVRDLRIRGLKYASKFVSELLLGVPEHVRNHHSCQEMNDDDKYDDIYEAAKASFDLREYLRVNEMLKKAPKSKKSQFLQLYSLYLVRVSSKISNYFFYDLFSPERKRKKNKA
jgi:predicted small metal-binding protein